MTSAFSFLPTSEVRKSEYSMNRVCDPLFFNVNQVASTPWQQELLLRNQSTYDQKRAAMNERPRVGPMQSLQFDTSATLSFKAFSYPAKRTASFGG